MIERLLSEAIFRKSLPQEFFWPAVKTPLSLFTRFDRKGLIDYNVDFTIKWALPVNLTFKHGLTEL